MQRERYDIQRSVWWLEKKKAQADETLAALANPQSDPGRCLDL
jgi:hypothetical protein